MKSRKGPVGYCEVKRPSLSCNQEKHLCDSDVLGQAYDYAMELRHQHGVIWAFVLITTFKHRRVLWLDDSACREAAGAKDISAVCERSARIKPSDTGVVSRNACASNIGDGENNNSLAPFLASVLLKMAHSPIVLEPSSKRLWPLLSMKGMSWKTFNVVQCKHSYPRNPGPPFYRIRALGSGRDGLCWEVAKGKELFVMKVIRRARGRMADKDAKVEADNRETIWKLRARHVVVMGRDAVVMPFMQVFSSKEEFCINKQGALEALHDMAAKGFVHNDLMWPDGNVKWHHFGLLEQGGKTRVITIDLSRMSPAEDKEAALKEMMDTTRL